MLNEHLKVKTSPVAKAENVIFWEDYRITVLGPRLFRMENNGEKIFRDAPTQAVWFRDMPAQEYQTEIINGALHITTSACVLKVCKERKNCKIRFFGRSWQPITNAGNLLGTCRTLDECDGETLFVFTQGWWEYTTEKVKLETGVCSRSGVAVYDDVNSLTLGDDGAVNPERGLGTDEYIFAFDNNYREAVRALYMLTGKTPLVPRFALGNWWSRYHIYTQEEYMQLLTRFKENDVPLSVATIDMDWHWSTTTDEKFALTKQKKDSTYYVGNDVGKRFGWTGYSWNTDLFPDYRSMLKEIESMGLKITLNLHPADGVRFWEDQYEDMCKALGRDASSEEYIPFDITDDAFVNAYFDILHKPFEKEGVAFWWIDWQQGTKTKMDGLDPLWSLNHYHYLDNARDSKTPLILSRYSGVGSHRYPLGFSGDTEITWKMIDYLPYFTATASNIGYSWWSHDIGGHHRGEKDDEMFVRHVQFGVLSPINRLHCGNWEPLTKEPWYFMDGKGEIVKNWLRFRHRLVPYLYSASYRTHEDGLAIIEPLYYQWDIGQAYEYKNEYIFGGHLLVAPVTTKAKADGYARIKVWLPQGIWTDIFTGDRYVVGAGGSEKTLMRTTDSIPVLAPAGCILPLAVLNGENAVNNPKKLEICVWEGDGEFTLCEDGQEQGSNAVCRTKLTAKNTMTEGACIQTLRMQSVGDTSVMPANRTVRVVFKDIPANARVRVYIDGKETSVQNLHLMNAAAEFVYDGNEEVVVYVEYEAQTEIARLLEQALEILKKGAGEHRQKLTLWREGLKDVKTMAQYVNAVDSSKIESVLKLRLKESL